MLLEVLEQGDNVKVKNFEWAAAKMKKTAKIEDAQYLLLTLCNIVFKFSITMLYNNNHHHIIE